MRIIFFGTGEFGVPSLKRIYGSTHEICAVVTQPDKKKGRGWKVQPSCVKAVAEHIMPGIKVLQPESTKDNNFADSLREYSADIFVVIDYGCLLTEDILSIPENYCINLHPSLLPKYRGAAPVNRALLNGEKVTGNTVIKMDERMDAGDIISQEEFSVGPEEDAVKLSERLSLSGAELVVSTLDLIADGNENFIKQNDEKATYAPKLKKSDGEISWEESATGIINKIRALKPWPGAFTYINGKRLKIKEASIFAACPENSPPGTIIDNKKLVIAVRDGAIIIKQLQIEGKKVMLSEEFLRGHIVNIGDKLG